MQVPLQPLSTDLPRRGFVLSHSDIGYNVEAMSFSRWPWATNPAHACTT
jgi:hypothetical protein